MCFVINIYVNNCLYFDICVLYVKQPESREIESSEETKSDVNEVTKANIFRQNFSWKMKVFGLLKNFSDLTKKIIKTAARQN